MGRTGRILLPPLACISGVPAQSSPWGYPFFAGEDSLCGAMPAVAFLAAADCPLKIYDFVTALSALFQKTFL